MQFWRFDWRNAAEMSLEFVFTILLPYFYIAWLIYMAAYYPVVLAFAVAIIYLVYIAVNVFSLGVAISASERWREEMGLFWSIPFFPLYKGLFRWVRIYAITLELFHINYEQTYLPESAWRNARRW
jgi:hypothetical protein